MIEAHYVCYGTWYFLNPGGIDINDEVKDKTGVVILSKLSLFTFAE